MENIRSFFNKVDDSLGRYEEVIKTHHSLYGYPSFGNIDYFDICDIIHKIANKLFSMNKDDRPIYAKLVIELIDIEQSSIELYDYEEDVECYQKQMGEGVYSISMEPINGYKKTSKTIYILECGPEKIKCDVGSIKSDVDCFITDVFCLFIDFGIDISSIINNICNDSSPLKDIYDSIIKYGKRSGIEINKRRNQRNPITANQQYDTIKALLDAAEWKGADNTKIAEFVAWLVNGSQSYIRQYILSGENRDKDKKEADSKLIEEKFKLIGITYSNGKIRTKQANL